MTLADVQQHTIWVTAAFGKASRAAAWRELLTRKIAVVALAVIVVIVLFCFVGPLVYHTNQIATNLADSSKRPSAAHLLGTDDLGYDELGRLMVGGQTTLEIAAGAAIGAVLIGMFWGAVAGFFGGVVDTIMMRIVDAVLAIPLLLLVLFLASIVSPTTPLLILVVGFVAWLVPARLIRAETLTLRTREYVQAAKIMGRGPFSTIWKHILRNSIGTVIVNATFQVADAILLVAYLSYLGFGLPAPAASWGEMLNGGLNYIYDGYWWLVYPAGTCIVVTVVALNLLGDALRDVFDARVRAPGR